MSLTPTERLVLQRRLARRRRRRPPWLVLLAVVALALLAVPTVAVAAGVAGAAFAYGSLAEELDVGITRIESVEDRSTFETTRITDRNGTLLRLVINEGKRTYVPLPEMSRSLIEATVAVEDDTFYTNPGIDPEAIGRAVWGETAAAVRRMLLGQADAVSLSGGGSTITQQFVRHVAFSHEERMARSYRRKAKEIVLALMITEDHDKSQILEWYLNEIYYGNLAYGVEAAAQTLFDKSASELDLAESALLAGLPQCPTCYDPLNPDPDVREATKRRQRLVLDLMVEAGFVTSAEADAAARRVLTFADPDDDLFLAPHFVVYVEDQLEEMLGAERLALGGLQITTSLDLPLQRLGERVVREHVEELREDHNLTNSSLVAMEPRTGQILAMVGSVDYFNDEIDGKVNVSLRPRQPGSSIKPITYLAAIERGMSPASVLWDVPLEIDIGRDEPFEPTNYDETFRGPVRLRSALANSYNIPALKLLRDIPPLETEEGAVKYGVEQTIDLAHRMGITGLNNDPWSYGLSLTLGGGEVTLLDMTTAYGTMANRGGLIRPQAILTVTDSAGNVLYSLQDDEPALAPQEAASPEGVYVVTDMLADNQARTPAFGPSSDLHLGVPAAAKTGTTNDYRDNWTMGFTPYLVTGVWAGNSDNSRMIDSSGLTGAAPIWNGFMRNVVADDAYREVVRTARESFGFPIEVDFERPDGVVDGRICDIRSLKELSTTCRRWGTELFIEDRMPDDVVTVDAESLPDATTMDVEDGTGDAENASAPLAALSPPQASGQGWTTVSAVVVPMPPPPPELVAQAEEEGEPLEWAPARLCRPDPFGLDKAQPVAVVDLPPLEEDHEFIYEWARENGWAAIDAADVCSPEMADAALPPGSLPGPGEFLGDGTFVASEGIASEYRLAIEPGTRLSETTVLTGTVVFDPEQIEYFKVELGSGRQPTEWITLGSIHEQSVVDGPLETLDAAALPPGDYIVRLVLVKTDGNFLQPPHSVPVVIGPPDQG